MASLAAHVMSLCGLPIPFDEAFWVLHIGVFVVWLPAVFVFMQAGRGRPTSYFGFGLERWKGALAGCPDWMRYFLYLLFAYAIINFLIAMQGITDGPLPEGATPPSVVRAFSGHWLVFYYSAFAICYSAYMKPELLRTPKCPNGHKASHADAFCSVCGVAIESFRKKS